MLPEVRAVLIEKTKKKIEDWGLNWKTIQKVDIKKEYECPVGWRTLHKLVKDSEYSTYLSVQKSLLEYYNVTYSENYGIVQLLKLKSDA
jgi:hypothetical protein|tara:strand:+ start:132 stop:398 length:267 start_codon:yes stop_codon:yes gene_type:complete